MKRYLLFAVLFVLLVALIISACSEVTVTKTVTPPATTSIITLSAPIKTIVKTTTVTVQAEAIEKGWVRLNVKGVSLIEYPIDFLELQSGDYKNIAEEFGQIWELLVPDFTLQQVGLNDFEPSAFLEYRRVMFFAEYLYPGEEVLRADEMGTFSESELAILEYVMVEQLKQEFQTMGISFIESVSLEIKAVNGMYPLVHTYKRQLDDNPIVLVQSYTFQNYDMIHYLIFSYRLEDEEECKDIYDKILASFRLYDN